IVHLSIGGRELRVRLSNRFGTAPLYFSGIHIAKAVSAGSDKIVAGSDKALSFSGRADITIPAGADYLSDPIAISAPDLSDLDRSLVHWRPRTAGASIKPFWDCASVLQWYSHREGRIGRIRQDCCGKR